MKNKAMLFIFVLLIGIVTCLCNPIHYSGASRDDLESKIDGSKNNITVTNIKSAEISINTEKIDNTETIYKDD